MSPGGGTSRVVVKVPKSLQGKVIGKGAATLRDLESDYPGVKVSVPKRDDPSEDVIIEGPADGVERARARVLDICGMAPDLSSGARADAQRLYDEMETLFQKAKETHDNEERRRLKDLAHKKRQEAETAQKIAAQRIFEAKNSGYGDDQMDLHGLYVSEAVEIVRERLTAVDGDLRSGRLQTLTIITGAGHHSDNNKAKIKPEIFKLLNEGNYPFKEDESGGMYLVSFVGVEPAITPGVEPSKPVAAPLPASPTTRPPQQQTQQQQPQQQSGKEEGTSWEPFVAVAVALCSCFAAVCWKSSEPQPEENAASQQQQGSAPREVEMNRVVEA